MSDTRTIDELYAEDLRLEGEIAKIKRQQLELQKLISAREAAIITRVAAAMREDEK